MGKVTKSIIFAGIYIVLVIVSYSFEFSIVLSILSFPLGYFPLLLSGLILETIRNGREILAMAQIVACTINVLFYLYWSIRGTRISTSYKEE